MEPALDILEEELSTEPVLETVQRKSCPRSLCWRQCGEEAVHEDWGGDIVEELSTEPVLETLEEDLSPELVLETLEEDLSTESVLETQ